MTSALKVIRASGRYIGIDPGVTGAVAMVQYTDRHRLVQVYDTPVVDVHQGKRRKHDFNISAMRGLLIALASGRSCVIIEEVHGWPGMDVRSVTSLIRGAGLWEGLCAGLGIPVHRVSPLAWKRHHRLLKTDKAESRVRAAEQFPLQDLGPKTKTGRADALLIACYGRAMNY